MYIRPPFQAAFRCGRQLPAQQQHAGISTTCLKESFRKDLVDNRAVPTRKSSWGRPALGPTEKLQNIWANSSQGGRFNKNEVRKETVEELANSAKSHAYMRQMPRRFQVGEVYAPRDLSPFEMQKFRKARSGQQDVLDVLGLNPLDNYKNFSMISEFMTSHGRIKHSDETGLRPVNQRKMAKAIRRAIGLGLHPSVHRHPELIKRVAPNVKVQSMPSTDMQMEY